MSDDEVNLVIEEQMKEIAKLLPDGFETDDLLEDLRFHINESYNDKVRDNPEEDKLTLIREVLEDLGTPEEIAEEYGKVEVEGEEQESRTDRRIYYTMRLVLVVVVVFVASWVASVLTEGAVDFVFAVVVLLAFAVLEWLVRTQQTKDV